MQLPLTRDDAAPRTRVFLACSGLGLIRRGYETFMRACFESLRDEPGLDVFLFKGSGERTGQERALRHFRRDGVMARALGGLVGRGPYVVEQATFAASLLPHVLRERPDVIYFCDPAIGKFLSRWRQLRGGSYRLLFHNSGPIPPPFPWYDHVHQVTPVAMDAALAAGESQSRQTLLPCALEIGPAPAPPSPHERMERRRALGLPESRPVVLSVGALNRNHKRMDYLVAEIASMPEPRPHLVMLGQVEADTPAVRAVATLLLGADGFSMRSVEPEAVGDFYRAADVFTLASLTEGFGLGYAEALGHGLPCIAHDFPVSRYVLGEEGIFADLRQRGALAGAIGDALAITPSSEGFRRRHAAVHRRFSWPALRADYVTMLRRCAGRPYEARTAA